MGGARRYKAECHECKSGSGYKYMISKVPGTSVTTLSDCKTSHCQRRIEGKPKRKWKGSVHSPERRARCDRRERRAAATVTEVGGVGHNGVAPPGLDGGEADGAVPGELQAEVDEDDRDCNARV